MDRHRSRWIGLVVLLATLLGSLAQPAPAQVAASADAAYQPGIARGGMRQGGIGATAVEPGDELLVRPSLQHPIQDSVFYFVLPDRFSNADHANDVGDDPGGAAEADVLRHGFLPQDKGYFHGGDLAGLTARLDYLQGLGVSAIWMTPVLKNRPVQGNGTIAGSSAGYHGYWITDFTQVDPHLGSNHDLHALVDAAHSRGMKVFFDIITNHTADVIAYEGGQSGYRNKTDFPYKDASGTVFDDADYAGTETFPPLSPEVSFPYQPVFPNPADATVKQPDWLNNRIYYHNRGDSSFVGENSLYGDFFGLDDLFTEHPDVARGMVDIYKSWISDYGIDGYRIDTVKHVNIEFWQRFGPEIMAHAQSAGKSDFFMYGEVFSGDVPFLSEYSTNGKLPAVLDFGFQGSARAFASRSGATNSLKGFFEADDYYTDADSNAYSLPTFLGNHDMGRFGLFLKQDNAGADDAELLARDRLAHALMFFSRGMPVVYYGDEQGFTGDGGDKDAREDMFASQVPGYNDNDLIGTDSTTAVANFNPSHPLYQSIKAYGDLRAAHKALRRGAQIHRFSGNAAGIYAFSRIERDEQIEYVVAFNNAETDHTATFKTYMPNAGFAALHPAGGPLLTTGATGEITVSVPALSFVIYRAGSPLPASTAAPGIAMRAPQPGQQVSRRFEVGADLDADVFAEVTFAVKAGDAAEYTVIGTDNNAPYRVFYDATKLEDGTPLTFKAIVSDLSGNLNSATVQAVVGAETCPPPGYAVIHYQRPAGDYDGWGLHLWGDAIDPSEATEWTSPKPFEGQDEYGVFAFIKLADASKPLNFIIHKGDEKDTPDDRSFSPSETPEIWVKQGDAAHHPSAAQALGRVRVHYQRPGGDYEGWGLHLWGEAIDPSEATEWTMPKLPTGTDGYGVYFDILLADATKAVNFIVHKGDEKDTPDDRSFIATESRTGDIWLMQGDAAAYTTRAAAENVAIIHYHRPGGDYGDATSANFADYWGLHVWAGAQTPTEWTAPLKPAGQDRFGIYFRVPLAADATALSYIIHKGDQKDLPEDQELDLATFGNEVWILQSTPDYLLPIVSDCTPGGGTGDADLSKQKAHWVMRDTIAWNVEGGAANNYKLHYDPTGAITLGDEDLVGGQTIDLTYDPAGLSDAIKAKFPHLAAYGALKIGAADLEKVPAILKGQFFVSARGAAGKLLDATGLQLPGVLDDLYTYDGPLGVIYHGRVPTLKVWAPTARSVTLRLFDSSTTALSTTIEMTNDAESGVWSATGTRRWTDKFYLYEVEVYVPATGVIERNLVTDPYAISLSMNSRRSQIVNLAADERLQPEGWKNLGRHKPALVAPEDIVLYELHLRDFSINDRSVPEAYRGTYMAFTKENSRGMRHLENLAEAGLTHVHLLPVFDIATIEEDKSLRREPDWDLLNSYPPDSEQQQAAVLELRNQDGFNWGYDPYHYTTPEGSYSTDPNGSRRVREFREMVRALNNTGLRVVIDVVYNHTNSSGQAEKSVLDRVVPGYYHRLNLEGAVETSTCCQNTATEHAMMEKLMVDSVVTWATAYKVDGFRFDLMGHHMKSNMLKVRAALDALTLEQDGVDGKRIYVYGEGWNFGEVADNARGVNATQLNMAGTGIGSFNDRLRDAVRGGGPFSGLQEQGFATGLLYDPNATDQGTPDDQLAKLLRYMDQIRVGLAGNLREYTFVDRSGATVTGAQVDYNGQPAGYTLDPQETITYVEAHDNETLFDAIQLKAAPAATLKDRVRMQNLAISLVMLSQGVPFFHAGQDMLRSKSMDRNSYDSGDWFNKLDFSYNSNNWGAGLPPAPENGSKWPIMGPLLADPALKPAKSDIVDAVDHFRELLEIRKSSPLFRLRTAEEIKARLTFLNTGPDQVPGLIVMSLSDTIGADLDKNYERIVVLFNAGDEAKSFTVWPLRGQQVRLHPVQANSEDSVVRTARFDRATGTFNVPARTTAVFVLR